MIFKLSVTITIGIGTNLSFVALSKTNNLAGKPGAVRVFSMIKRLK